MKSILGIRRAACLGGLLVLCQGVVLAQGTSPWVDAVNLLQVTFTGPIARGLSLVAIVVGGLMFAFGEGGSKLALAQQPGHRAYVEAGGDIIDARNPKAGRCAAGPVAWWIATLRERVPQSGLELPFYPQQ